MKLNTFMVASMCSYVFVIVLTILYELHWYIPLVFALLYVIAIVLIEKRNMKEEGEFWDQALREDVIDERDFF